ncbi:hypothetical protein B0A48_07770 [Cryoendolithus antarcticus]|uniref:Uncharacterized protein n=1 Tax=Cryoendolithus antarcticus TaxID=1507870 RepID=A0A1V8T773_9PEZI|nr:hypothetical protein B0A48_07770 [Cryoendolithus antarcticus]
MELPTNNQMTAAYFIYRDTSVACENGTAPLAFFPAKDSDELFDALRAKYSHIKSHADRVREATIEFFMEEQASLTVSTAPSTVPAMYETTADLSPWQQSWPSESMTTLSSPETMSLSTPSVYEYPAAQQTPQVRHSSAGLSTSVASPRALENMTSVFSLSTSEQPKQRVRRKMTEAEKVEYRKRRIVKACEKCKARKRKCIHNEPEVDKPSRKVAKSQSGSKKNISHSNAAVQPQAHDVIDFDFESFINDIDVKAPSNDFGDFTLMYDDDLTPELSFDSMLDIQQPHLPFDRHNTGHQPPLNFDEQSLQYDFWPSQTSSHNTPVDTPSSDGSLQLRHASSSSDQLDWRQDVTALVSDNTGLGQTWLDSEVHAATEVASHAQQRRVAPHSWGGSGLLQGDTVHAVNVDSSRLDASNHGFVLSNSSGGSSQEPRTLHHDVTVSPLVTNAAPCVGIATDRGASRVNNSGLQMAIVNNSDGTTSENGSSGITRNGNSENGTTINGTSVNGTSVNGTSVNGKAASRTSVNGTAVSGTAVSGTAVSGTAVNGTLFDGTKRPTPLATPQLATTSALSARPSLFDATPSHAAHRASASDHYVQLLTMKRRASNMPTPTPLLQTIPTASAEPIVQHANLQANGGAYPWLDTPHAHNPAGNGTLEAPIKLQLSAFASTEENGRATELAGMYRVVTESDTQRLAWVLAAFAVCALCAVLDRIAGMQLSVEPTMLMLALLAPLAHVEGKPWPVDASSAGMTQPRSSVRRMIDCIVKTADNVFGGGSVAWTLV